MTAPLNTATPQTRKGKVLVVDDDKIVLRAATEILSREGYQVMAIDDAQKSGAAASYLVSNKGRVADALLAVTDARAAKSNKGTVKSMYEKLRGSAKKNVEEAVPRLAKLLEKHLK